jgi:hypothetical protein
LMIGSAANEVNWGGPIHCEAQSPTNLSPIGEVAGELVADSPKVPITRSADRCVQAPKPLISPSAVPTAVGTGQPID